MARKRKQGVFEDLIGIAALLPWWVGVLLALITYFALHHFATAVVATPMTPGHIGTAVVYQFGKVLALYGQYLVPMAFLIGAGSSAYGRHKRAALFSGISKDSSLSALNGMTWHEFERLVGEAFRRMGYTVSETGGGGADGGVDLVLKKDDEKFLVQCKQWKAYKVGVTTIRELYGVMAAGSAAGGFVVTSGVFTQEAKSFADGRNIDLIDGSELTAIIKKIQQQPQATTAATQAARPSSPGAIADPSCPKCGNVMIKRTAKQGANRGNAFWGCTTFPQCHGTIPIN